MKWENLLFVGIGGFFGANARYVLAAWVAVRLRALFGIEFPYGTLVVNVLGSFLLAIFGVWFVRQVGLSDNVRLLVGTGFFGAFTTFSTYANESIALMQNGNWAGGVANIVLTNTLCLIGVVIGLWFMRTT